MKLKLYVTTSPNNAVTKQLSEEFELDGTLRDGEFNILNPVVRVARNVSKYNYAFIPAFGRYYFIDNIRVASNEMFYVTFRCDVLMTYSEEIRALFGEMVAETNGSPYGSVDIETEARHDTSIVKFESPFTDGDYIVIAMNSGGV